MVFPPVKKGAGYLTRPLYFLFYRFAKFVGS